MTEKFDALSLMPDDTPDYMAPAWIGLIEWAIGEKEIVACYRKETGDTWEPGQTPLEQKIDAACGADRAFMKRFILWVNENLWGKIDNEEDAS